MLPLKMFQYNKLVVGVIGFQIVAIYYSSVCLLQAVINHKTYLIGETFEINDEALIVRAWERYLIEK